MKLSYLIKLCCFLLILQGSVFAKDLATILQVKAKIEKQTGLKLYFKNKSPPVSWKVTSKKYDAKDFLVLEGYLLILLGETAHYTKKYFKTAGLKGFVIIKDLKVNGQARAAMPDYYNEYLYYDFKAGTKNSDYQKAVIHHEFYHNIEEEINGSAYFKDPKWMKLNTKGFTYGKGGKYMRGGKAGVLNHPKPGFIDGYATSGLEEDKAEIYASFFVPSYQKKVWGFAKKDKIIKKKITFMAKTIKSMDPAVLKNINYSAPE